MLSQCSKRRSEPTGISPQLVIGFDGVLGAFDETTVGNAARTGRFTTTTLDTSRQRIDGVVVERLTIPLHGAHDGDPTAGRMAFLSCHPVGRTVRKTEPTTDARCQLVVGKSESGHGRHRTLRAFLQSVV